MIPSPSVVNRLTWLIALVPALAALLFLRPSDITGAGAVLNYLGRLTGIAGLALMLVSGALICRVPGADRPFGGLTKMWQLHHRLGGAAFLLILAHPLLLALAAAEHSPKAAVATLIPSPSAISVWLGWAALLSMMVFLAPGFGFFGNTPYQRWKGIHRLSGLSITLALIHTVMLERTIASPWDNILWSILALLAIVSVAYRFVFSRFWGKCPYRVDRVTPRANNVVELSLQPRGGHIDYMPGQFVYMTPRDKTLVAGCGEEHPYTLSSAPGESNLRVAIKDLGDASRAIQDITPGSEVDIEGPYGDFFPRSGADPGPELWIAGGIGITPFLSRLRDMELTGNEQDIHLVYCVQDEERALFAEELTALESRLGGYHLVMHFFYREGPLNGDFIIRHCPDYSERRAFICGPVPLIKLARHILVAGRVPAGQITTEEFALLLQQD